MQLITDASKATIGTQTEDPQEPIDESEESEPVLDEIDVKLWLKSYYRSAKQWINQQENKGLKLSLIIMTGMVFAMFWYLLMQVSRIFEVLVYLCSCLYIYIFLGEGSTEYVPKWFTGESTGFIR